MPSRVCVLCFVLKLFVSSWFLQIYIYFYEDKIPHIYLSHTFIMWWSSSKLESKFDRAISGGNGGIWSLNSKPPLHVRIINRRDASLKLIYFIHQIGIFFVRSLFVFMVKFLLFFYIRTYHNCITMRTEVNSRLTLWFE